MIIKHLNHGLEKNYSIQDYLLDTSRFTPKFKILFASKLCFYEKIKSFCRSFSFDVSLSLSGCKDPDLSEVPMPERAPTESHNLPSEPEISLNSYTFLTNSIYAQISQSNGMLAFADSNHFKAVIEDLELHGEANGQDTILTLFENHFSFTSLRKTINDDLDVWLDAQGREMDYNLSPDNHFVEDDYVMSVLNPLGEVKIGVPIYKFWEDGLIFQITNGDLATLEILRETYPSTERLPENVIIENLPESGGGDVRNNCKANGKHAWYPSDFYLLDWEEHRTWIKLVVRNYPFVHYGKAKMKTKKLIHGKWKNTSVTQTAQVFGEVRGGGNCADLDSPKPLNAVKTKNASKVNAKKGNRGVFRIENGMVKGLFIFPHPDPARNSLILSITW